MTLEIPAYNLFMMCESLRREAFAPLPAGYSVRLCREDELEIWMALNAESPESLPFLQDYYQRVYQSASLSATARTPRWAPAFCGRPTAKSPPSTG